jgi:hypothetical protein
MRMRCSGQVYKGIINKNSDSSAVNMLVVCHRENKLYKYNHDD